MSQISKFPLSKQVEEQLRETFLDSIVLIDRKDLAKSLVDDLFTPTEKIMIGKRILIALLLQRGYSYRDIMTSLNVTSTTINSVKKVLMTLGQGFKKLAQLLEVPQRTRERKFQKEEQRKVFANKLSQLLDVLQLPVKGSPTDMRRWKRVML